jgi:hypothetical protein
VRARDAALRRGLAPRAEPGRERGPELREVAGKLDLDRLLRAAAAVNAGAAVSRVCAVCALASGSIDRLCGCGSGSSGSSDGDRRVGESVWSMFAAGWQAERQRSTVAVDPSLGLMTPPTGAPLSSHASHREAQRCRV